MMKKISILSVLFYLIIIISFPEISLSSQKPEPVLIYGQKHLFSVFIPKDWVLDRQLAKQLGLGSFFYPQNSFNSTNTYIYAQGWDKESYDESLSEFIKADLEKFKIKHPKVTFEKRRQGFKGAILDAWLYTFSNMEGFYKEDVLYLETETCIITLVFSTKSKKDYDKYISTFDKFVNSFEFLSGKVKIHIK